MVATLRARERTARRGGTMVCAKQTCVASGVRRSDLILEAKLVLCQKGVQL